MDYKIRTITVFITLTRSDFDAFPSLMEKVSVTMDAIRPVRTALESYGYSIQTIRLATNSFEDWLDTENVSKMEDQLYLLDTCLEACQIDFSALGPAANTKSIEEICPRIVASSFRFSCSAKLNCADVRTATAAAKCVKAIAAMDHAPHVRGGLGNFRFCVAASIKPNIPFFPIAMAASAQPRPSFAIGLENGSLARHILEECGSVQQIGSLFRSEMAKALLPIQQICSDQTKSASAIDFAGIDTSLNPSLEESGSVGRAIESLTEVKQFGGPGTLAVAAALTQAIQSLPDIQLTGYCGLMLPLCEDVRLAELAEKQAFGISKLLNISSVCGVGVDTVPVPHDTAIEDLASLFLDVAGISHRWGKTLSCRVFPVMNGAAGDRTHFSSPYLVNSRILSLTEYR